MGFMGILALVVSVACGSGAVRVTKDSAGREWTLENWEEGGRPYPKDLLERERWYLLRNGEPWGGSRFGNRILTPGAWKWETVVTLPEPLSSRLWVTKDVPNPHHHKRWGGNWPMAALIASAGGEAIDLYLSATTCIVHVDLATKNIDVIGEPGSDGLTDGVGGAVRLSVSLMTADPATGRVYWVQGGKLRYVEKLLPYRDDRTGAVLRLPAVLDSDELYHQVTAPSGGALHKVYDGTKRGAATFAVRTCTRIERPLHIPGAQRGQRPLITPDGRGVYVSDFPTWKEETNYDRTTLVDIESGAILKRLKLPVPLPQNMTRQPLGDADGAGSHGGACVGMDGQIYTAQHTGSGGGPARLIGLDPDSGLFATLYDSVQGQSGKKRKSPVWDGPADTASLTASSTDYQTQCPRTGAIINGGWDNSGIRRYFDGFVTTIVNGDDQLGQGRPGWGNWARGMAPAFAYHNSEPAIAPNGDLYVADSQVIPQRVLRFYRTDWPSELPVYGFGDKHLPKKRLRELLVAYARDYVKKNEYR